MQNQPPQQNFTQQDVPQQNVPQQNIPQQQQYNQPPQHTTVQMSTSANQNDLSMQNQQMMLNAQLLQQIQGNSKSNLPSNVQGATLPVHIFCNNCKTETITKVSENPCTIYTWLWFCCCFYTLIAFLCFCPGMCKNQHSFKHYCSSCGAQVGEKQAQCS